MATSRTAAAALVEAAAGADLVIGAGDFCNRREGLGDAMAMLAGIAALLLILPALMAGTAPRLDTLFLSPRMAALEGEARRRGVVVASAGNHGLGVAFAGRQLGIPALVVVPLVAIGTLRRRSRVFPGHDGFYDHGGKDELHVCHRTERGQDRDQ